VTKSKSVSWGVARWSTGLTDHITGSDQYNRHADQCQPRGDDAGQCQLRGDDAGQCQPKGNDDR